MKNLADPDRANEKMKLRHAAALALVGWYLLAPPVHKEGATKQESFLAFNAPLENWKTEGAYGNLQQCRDAIAARQNAVGTRQGSLIVLGETIDNEVSWLQCRASDDPLLKRN